jgi:Tfp pilus assembly protein PilE
MSRGVGLLSLLVALVVVGMLWTTQMGHSPDRAQAKQEIDQATQAATALSFQQASTALEQFHALNGSYAGASLAGFGVMLARADASSYCIQTSAAHLNGPDGSAEPGPC